MESHDIKRWSGPRSLPMWVPLPDFAGFATRDTSPARDSGLVARTLSETARDTLLWSRTASGPVTGLTANEETEALKAWHARRHQRDE
jgi:2'-hydroxyisoflavone reductase